MREKPVVKALKALAIIIILAWTLFPIYWMLTLSFRASSELSGELPLIPQSFSLDNFKVLFERHDFLNACKNSIIVTMSSLLFALIFGLCCSYVLSRKRFRFALKGPLIFWTLLVRVLPPIAFAIPLYLLMVKTGLLTTKIPVILTHILINIPFIVWFMVSFFTGVSESLEESAAIDGASEFQIFRKIILPLVTPGITAVAILSFMTSWSEYLFSVIFVQKASNFTVPLALASLNSETELTQWGVVAAGGCISLIPVIIFVAFSQSYLIKGLAAGAVKE